MRNVTRLSKLMYSGITCDQGISGLRMSKIITSGVKTINIQSNLSNRKLCGLPISFAGTTTMLLFQRWCNRKEMSTCTITTLRFAEPRINLTDFKGYSKTLTEQVR